MTTLYAFLAHPKSLEDAAVDRLRDATHMCVATAIKHMNGNAIPDVTAGRDDFNARAMACGGWEAWVDSVATGQGYRDGVLRAYFDVIVVAPDAAIGKATARIVEQALAGSYRSAPRPVFFMPDPDAPDGGLLYPVTAVRNNDPSNFRSGSTLVFRQPLWSNP